MKDANGQMVATDIVLGELAGKWDTLSDAQKNAFIQDGAGIHRRNQFLVLMENWNDVMANTDAAMNSQGVAAEKNAIFMDSYQGSVNKFKNEMEKLYISVLSPDNLKAWVDLGTNITEFVNILGVGNVALLAFGGAMLIFADFPAIAGMIGTLTLAIQGVTTGTWSLTYALNGLGVSAKALTAIPLVAVITAVAGAFIYAQIEAQKFVNKQNELTESSNKLTDAYFKNKESADAQLKSLSDLVGVKELSVKQDKRIEEVTAQLQKLYPTLLDNIDTEKGKLEGLIEAYNAVSKAAIQSQVARLNAERVEIAKELTTVYTSRGPQGLAVDSGAVAHEEDAKSKAVLARLKANAEAIQKSQAELANFKGITTADIKGEKESPYIPPNGGGGSPSKSNDYLSTLSTRYQDLEKAITLTNESLRINQGLQNFVEGENKIRLLQEEIKLQQQLKTNLQDLNRERRAERDELISQISGLGVSTKTENDITTILNPQAIKSLSNDQQEMFDKLFGKVKDLNSNIKSTGETWYSANDKIKSSYKAIQDEMDSIKDKKLKELNEALEAQKKQLKKQFDEEYDKLSKLSDLQEIADEKAIDAKQSEIEAIKKKNDEIDRTNERLEKELELQKALDERANILANRNVRFLGANGFEFIADPVALKENQERVEDARKNLAEFNRKANEEAQIAIKEAELKQLQDTKEANKRTYDEKLRNLKSYQDQFLSDLDTNNIITTNKTTEHYNLLNSLDKKYADDKKALFQDMVNQINSILSQISAVSVPSYTTSISNSGVVSGNASASKSTSTTGGVSGTNKPSSAKKKYESGGLIDYTGMAWVDGSKSNPEVAFNQNDASKLWNFVQSGLSSTPVRQSSVSGSNGSIIIQNVNLPNVKDPQSFESWANKYRRVNS